MPRSGRDRDPACSPGAAEGAEALPKWTWGITAAGINWPWAQLMQRTFSQVRCARVPAVWTEVWLIALIEHGGAIRRILGGLCTGGRVG